MSKKERLSEFNRGNILIAAKKLFGEKGVFQTTVDDIAKEADYSKSTIYVYFTGKDDIYDHIILEHITILKEMIGAALNDSPGFPDGYYAVCRALVDFYNKNPLYFESILGEIKIPKSGGEAESVLVKIYEVGEEINALIEDYLKNCSRENSVSLSLPTLQMTFVLWATISGIITIANKKEVYINKAMGVTKEEFMQNGFDMLLKSIVGTL